MNILLVEDNLSIIKGLEYAFSKTDYSFEYRTNFKSSLDYILNNRVDLIILDVREPKDFNNGHLLNAINIPIEDIDKRMDELRNYKSKDIIVYCNTGRKSAEVAEKLVEHGFTDVTNIVDGVSEYDFKLVK